MFGCTASFARPTDLARHKRETHCTERQYLCEHENCGSKFYRKDDLRHHIRRKHDCPQFGRRAKRLRKGADSKEMVVKKGVRRKLSMKTEDNSAAEGSLGAGGGGTGSDATEGLDEPKVVIDLNVAKVNQLRKSIQINFV
ncbi:unnamed protein product [Oppiella nova]|nr:unnamed protein product [Oppiella nova]CAG2181983.1 unnamed protein product [Oppiella nova]